MEQRQQRKREIRIEQMGCKATHTQSIDCVCMKDANRVKANEKRMYRGMERIMRFLSFSRELST